MDPPGGTSALDTRVYVSLVKL